MVDLAARLEKTQAYCLVRPSLIAGGVAVIAESIVIFAVDVAESRNVVVFLWVLANSGHVQAAGTPGDMQVKDVAPEYVVVDALANLWRQPEQGRCSGVEIGA